MPKASTPGNAASFTAWDQLGTHRAGAQSLATLFNGDFGGAAVGTLGLAFACALVLAWAAYRAFVVARVWYGESRAPPHA